MTIPRGALALAIAGLIPFLWGLATVLVPALADFGQHAFGPRFIGPYVVIQYGTIIIAFMSGVLWGFATRATGHEAVAAYTASTLPALFAFFMIGGGASRAALMTAVGLVLVLLLDWVFSRRGLTPYWWLTLRVPITTIAVLCVLGAALA